MNISDLIYDWNRLYPQSLRPPGPVLLTDETLRDGLQSPSVRDPSIKQKIEILHLMEALGINSLDLGFPGAGPRAVEHVTALAREIVAHKMKVMLPCLLPFSLRFVRIAGSEIEGPPRRRKGVLLAKPDGSASSHHCRA